MPGSLSCVTMLPLSTCSAIFLSIQLRCVDVKVVERRFPTTSKSVAFYKNVIKLLVVI